MAALPNSPRSFIRHSLGGNSTAEQRLALNAYLLAGLTEYWRAYRQYAGVLHFVYLTSSDPAGYTADHFRDVTKLELHPRVSGLHE